MFKENLFSALAAYVRDLLSEATELKKRCMPHDRMQLLYTKLLGFQSSVRILSQMPGFSDSWRELSGERLRDIGQLLELLSDRRNSLSLESLQSIRPCLLITGGPGAGKTTRIRRLARQIAREDANDDPVVLRAMDIEDPSPQGILERGRQTVGEFGLVLSSCEFRRRFADGSLRLMVDGLDESREHLEAIKDSIVALASEFPNCSLVVSVRDSVGFPEWKSALRLRVCAFSDEQLEQFIGQWFSAEPSKATGLSGWLADNKRMDLAARIPVIASLLCVLYGSENTDMPSTEAELYEGRVELLLGRWDQAKGLPVMPPQIRKRYKLFLMRVAYDAHCLEVKTFPYNLAQNLASKYMTIGYNSSPQSLVTDCIRRGLFLVEVGGDLTLGHLTYQEYLVGGHLARFVIPREIASRLGNDWWWQPLMFYASVQSDIGSLIDGLRSAVREKHFAQLHAMRGNAPLTSFSKLW